MSAQTNGFTLPFYHFSVPGCNCHSPRDGMPLAKTRDALFTMVLHERSRSTGWVVGKKVNGMWQYHPTQPPANPQSVKGGPLYYRSKALRHRIVRNTGYWLVRKICAPQAQPDCLVRIGDETLCSSRKMNPSPKLLELFQTLNPAILVGEPDPLMASLASEPMFNWCDLSSDAPFSLPSRDAVEDLFQYLPPMPAHKEPAANEAEALLRARETKRVEGTHKLFTNRAKRLQGKHIYHELICPLHGAVPPLKGTLLSSAASWKALCGRRYELNLCPHCLSVLHSSLTMMN